MCKIFRRTKPGVYGLAFLQICTQAANRIHFLSSEFHFEQLPRHGALLNDRKNSSFVQVQGIYRNDKNDR